MTGIQDIVITAQAVKKSYRVEYDKKTEASMKGKIPTSILSWLAGSSLPFISTFDLVRSHSAIAILESFQLLEKP